MSRFTRRAGAALAGAVVALAGLAVSPSASPAVAQQGQAVQQGQAEARLLRFPHVHGDRVVFTYAGDLYTASVRGGQATRLTSHEGLEIFARFSPDGRWIAFSGEYAGTRQVHLIPATGGEPRQLTFYPDVGPMPPRGGYDHLVLDWTPDGERILIRANRTPFGERVGRYYMVDPWNGGLEQPLEIPEGASGATFDPTGTKLAYNIKSREWRHWKRYEGGRQQDVWLYDLANHASERITEYTGTDNFPLWVGDAVYFVSDRGAGRKLNLWRYDTGTGETRQVTEHDEYDVLWPSRGEGGIVYENGGWLWHLDPATDRTRRLAITIPGDRPHLVPRWVDVAERVESFDIAPSGRRAVFGARGELFTVPAEHGDTRNLSRTEGHRERAVAWSPDGRLVAYLSDATGAYELYVRDAAGDGAPRQLTNGGDSWIFEPRWSPDSRWIAWADQDNRLRAVDVESGRIRELDRATRGRLADFAWAPDSRWVAYTKTSPNSMSGIWIHSFADGRSTQVTGDATDDRMPAFDPRGRYLYFVSARDFDYGEEGFRSRIFAATLRADQAHPFPPRSDEEPAAVPAVVAAAGGANTGGGAAGGAGGGPGASGGSGSGAAAGAGGAAVGSRSPASPVRIDLEGLGSRVVALPELPPGQYSGLTATDAGLLYVSNGSLYLYDLEGRKADAVLEGVRGYAITPDRSRLLYRKGNGNGFGIAEVRPGQNAEGGLDLSGLRMRVDPRVEWAQVYHDAWLIMRDWFYDPGLHGVDWQAMYDRYRPLVDHVAHRADLDYLIAELIAEINAGHAYVNSSPDMPGPERVDVGLLGAELEPAGEHYQVARIFPGENWHDEFRSPLTEPGVGVREGDFLLAIDGEPVTTADNPYRFLVDKVDRAVRLTVSDRADGRNPRTYTVRPVKSELGLRYQAWVARNAALVDSLSGGRIGYIHIPDTSIPGHRELFEGLRPQHTKDALILDDRYNGGGFIPEMMAFMMGRPVLNYWARRNVELYSQPNIVHTGPKAMLINGQSSSGGDALPYYFRQLGLGPLIGERTWGGLIGISGNPGFVDGGSISVPVFAFVDAEGRWAVEGEGVAPDIEVIDRPEDIAAGRERMIETAVQHLMRELEQPRPGRPGVPVGPDRAPPSGR